MSQPISFEIKPFDKPLSPAVKREWAVDWDALFQQLAASGRVVIEYPIEVSKEVVDQKIRGAALRRGMNVGIRHIDNDAVISLRPKKPSKHKGRNEAIRAAIEAGETMEAIGHRYCLSRQRVEQISFEKFTALTPGAGRRSASIEFLQPYLEHIAVRYCAVCGDEIERSETRAASRWLCPNCQSLQRVINKIKGHLTLWRNGYEKGKNQAVYLIRKHNIKPEHLAGKRAAGRTA